MSNANETPPMQYNTTHSPNLHGYPSIVSHLNLKPIPRHTCLILIDRGLAFLGGIVGLGEQHAVVSGLFLGFADAAGLGSLARWLIVWSEREHVGMDAPWAFRSATEEEIGTGCCCLWWYQPWSALVMGCMVKLTYPWKSRIATT